jgi:enamidase
VVVVYVAQGFSPAIAQQPSANPLAPFIKIQTPVVALVHARVIDGTGAQAREDQTLVIRDASIAALGDSARTPPPAGATIIDLTGKSMLPGLVMLHEHLYYTTGPGVYGQLGVSFSRLYLAGGVTTMRTAGNVNGIMDINISRRIAAGERRAPRSTRRRRRQRPELVSADARGADEARARRLLASQLDVVEEHADLASRAEGHDDYGHRRRMKVTGHLCSVTYGEAGSRHRQPRARILRRHRLRRRRRSGRARTATIAGRERRAVRAVVDRHGADATLTVHIHARASCRRVSTSSRRS